MSVDQTRDVIAWPTTPRTRNRLTAAWNRWRTDLFGAIPTGADDTWADQLRHTTDQVDDDTSTGRHYADNIATTLLRRPIAAITATGHYAVYDEHLGGLNPGPMEPAYLAGETKEGADR